MCKLSSCLYYKLSKSSSIVFVANPENVCIPVTFYFIRVKRCRIASCCLLTWVWPLRLFGFPLVNLRDESSSGKCDAG